jgi:uncharacterized protein (TIGR03437 family)
VNGPVVIDTSTSGLPAEATGRGTIVRAVEVDLARPAAVDALNGLFTSVADFYANMHTTQFPGGIIRGQLRNTDEVVFPVTMLPSNEVPPIPGLDARGVGYVRVNTLRDANGDITTGRVVFNVNVRFPGEVTFSGFHIHNQTAGNNGPVTIDTGITGTGNPLVSETGFLNIEKSVNVLTANGLATLNSLVVNPENHYVNLHTLVNPGGAIRAQLTSARTLAPVIGDVATLFAESGRRTVAPGGGMAIWGKDFAKVASTLRGWEGASVPAKLNGVEVLVGGRSAAVLSVYDDYVTAVLPFDAPTGSQPVMVRTGGVSSAPFMATVAQFAPVIWAREGIAWAIRQANQAFLWTDNPAAAGDTIVVYSTGMGQTTPALESGRVVTGFNRTSTVTATIGGRAAEVVSSLATGGIIGLYETTVRVPTGLSAGNQPLVLEVGGATSNTVNVPVR